MYPTIDELMSEVGCSRWPDRWNEIYDDVMKDYEKNGGTHLCDPDFYRDLHKRYKAFPHYLEVICEAAKKIAVNKALSRLLALLGASLADREHAWADVAAFSAPTPPGGIRDLATDMLTGLATVSMVEYSHEKLAGRNIPHEIILATTTMLEAGIGEFAKRHNGAYGYHLMNWNQRAIDGTIFRIGRLEIELCRYESRSVVFENDKGDLIALANGDRFHPDGAVIGSAGYEDYSDSFAPLLFESEDAYTGNPYDSLGRCSPEQIKLRKSEWKKLMAYGDKVIALHIPAGGSLAPDEVDRTLELAKKFVAEYFPEWDYRGFTCESWLLDPQLEALLGDESNIVRFGRRFLRISVESGGRSPNYFVFMRPMDEKIDVSSLTENTRLEHALKEHYLKGGFIYDVFGCISK